MQSQSFQLTLEKNPLISINVVPGHFTTGNNHVTHYLDVSGLKSNALLARDVARELAIPYLSTTLVHTIVCTERTEVIGAYLAEELVQGGIAVVNGWEEIHIVTPITNNIGHLYFTGSTIKWISNCNIILLANSISSGRTINSALDCIAYYGGNVIGISSLFLVTDYRQDQEINALFTSDDLPGYRIYPSRNCPMCQAGQKLDALISSEGYSYLSLK